MAFGHDTRGVSEVVGFILILGILILTLTTYQAAIVPQQNAQTEFQHFEDVRDEMIELRNAISTAGQADVSQFPSVRLGTNYQSRILTINPASPAGTLQTSDSYNISISDGDVTEYISTRFIEYQPGYNEITAGPTWYEHSVLYVDEPESENVLIIEDQNLVTDGNKLKITTLQSTFQRSGTNRVTVELIPNQSAVNLSDTELNDSEELTVRIPTRLNETEWEVLQEKLDGEENVDYGPFDDSESEINYLTLNVSNQKHLEINTVEIYS